MAGILIPRRQIWTRQPQVFTGFNPAFPRPSFAFVASLGGYERSVQRLGTPASGDSFRTTQQGIAYNVARATNGGLDFGVYQPITSDAFTIIVLANGASTDGIGTLFSQRTGSLPYNQLALSLNQDNAYGSRPGGFLFVAIDTSNEASGANWRSAHSDSTSLVDGRYHVFAATKASASSVPVLWYDGAIQAATAYGTGTATILGGAQQTRIGNIADYTADGAYCSESDIAAVLVFNRVLHGAMMRALTESLLAPYKIFQAPARWLFIGAPTSITLIGANSTQASSSSTGTVAQTNLLAAASSAQTAASQTGVVAQTHILSGTAANQSAASATAAVAQTHVLVGASSTQVATSASGTVASVGTLVASPCAQAANSWVGVVMQTHRLAGAACGQSAASASGAIAQAHRLSAAECGQFSYCATGAIAQIHVLIASNCTGAPTSGVGATVLIIGFPVSLEQWAPNLIDLGGFALQPSGKVVLLL